MDDVDNNDYVDEDGDDEMMTAAADVKGKPSLGMMVRCWALVSWTK